ncbi:hypothetical protein [Prescottella subtropica]|uniref:hypothetical protein n=1 Tax=Prescottella subtropica TaxID=2545757 RepID=UPI0010F84B1F|nr:hypothetical protein [Prescottella subtropica]
MTSTTTTQIAAPLEATTDTVWRQLSSRLGEFVDTITPRRDLVTVIGVDATPDVDGYRPAGLFDHTTATITVDAAQVLSPGDDPDRIDLRDPRDCARYPVLAGVTVHEVGHATHTARRLGMPRRAAPWVALLEEPRMEGRVVAGNVRTRTWLQAAAVRLLGDTTPRTAGEAARLLILVGGRVDAGVYDRDDLPDLAAAAAPFLTGEQIGVLVQQTRVAVGLDDGDIDGLTGCAVAIADVMEASDQVDDCDDDVVDHGGDDGGGSGVSVQVNEMCTDSEMRTEIHTDGNNDVAAAVAAMTRRAVAAVQAAENLTVTSTAEQQRRDTTAQLHRDTAAAGRASRAHVHRHTVRRPTPDELRQSARLNRLVAGAADRGATMTTVTRTTPPGRLRMRELVRREGQLAAGTRLSATPWSHTSYRDVDTPPVTVGIAIDNSPSMAPVLDSAAAAAWMVRRATRPRGGDSTAVTWNSDAAILPHETRGGAIHVPEPVGGSDGLPAALLALDAHLQLSRGDGPRLVTVISDADLPNPDEAEQHLRRLAATGTRLLWLIPGPEHQQRPGLLERLDRHLEAVTVMDLSEPARAADIIGDALAAVLRRW